MDTDDEAIDTGPGFERLDDLPLFDARSEIATVKAQLARLTSAHADLQTLVDDYVKAHP